MSAEKVLNNILGKKSDNKKETKEPTLDDAKDGIKGIFKPFKELYDKGKNAENDIWDKLKIKKDGS